MAILITGATGFIGSYVLNSLLQSTNENIIVLKRSYSNCDRIKNLILDKRVTCFDIDINSLENLFMENNVETIIHLATDYGRGENPEVSVLETNLMFPIRLIDIGLKYGLKSFINTDSYFNKEGLSYNYLFHYSLSKKSLRLWLEYYSKRLTVINLMLEHPYGAYDGEKKFTEQMIRKIAIDRVPTLDLTEGNQKRDFIYVKDVANSYIAALNYAKQSPNSFYNFEIGNGVAITIKEFVETIKNISSSITELNYGAIPYRTDEIMCSFADTSCQNMLNWKPQYSLREALREIIAAYKGDKNCNC